MAKRFTDSDKWKKTWFRGLSPINKCFWIYLLDNCDQAGVWEVDFGLAEIFIGEKLNELELKEVFNKQFEEVSGGKCWFIRDFIDFQYGELKSTNRMHLFVLNLIKKQGVSTPLKCPFQGAKDKDIHKDELGKGLLGENQKKAVGAFVPPTPEEATDAFTAGGLDTASAKVEASKFLAYYESVGWIVGKTRKPMKSWPGAVSTWLNNWRAWENEKSGPRPAVPAKRVDDWKCFVCDKKMPQTERRSHMDEHELERSKIG